MRLLKQLYPDTKTGDLADRLCRSEISVQVKAARLGVRKSKRYPGNNGKETQFKPKRRPHNFGIKGWQAGGNSVKTQFKPGDRPHSWVPVGSERISNYGILQRKISDTGYSPRDWKSVHSILWESHFGPVPQGHFVTFKNGNVKDIFIDNLEIISRAENMRRNNIHRFPPALVDLCRIRGVLTRRINERMKQNEK